MTKRRSALKGEVLEYLPLLSWPSVQYYEFRLVTPKARPKVVLNLVQYSCTGYLLLVRSTRTTSISLEYYSYTVVVVLKYFSMNCDCDL